MFNYTVRTTKNNRTDTKTVGFASLTIEECFAVNGILIIDGPNGRFISFPVSPKGNGDYKDIAFPITAECREILQKAILDSFEETLKNADAEPTEE